MKNQYFGDTRDLFKYDLCLELLSKTNIRKFTFIPMLTPNDNTNDGEQINKKARAGFFRKNLVDFLSKCVTEGKRNISMLEIFFKKFNNESPLNKEIECNIYGKDEIFANDCRELYFQNIPLNFLDNAVILVDPDNGLETKSKIHLDKYLKYSELNLLYEKMDKHSILVVFQHIPRVERKHYFSTLKKKIESVVKCSNVSFISDNQIVFFIICKDKQLHQRTKQILKEYARIHNLLVDKEV